jgi:hypothetical protein
MVEAAILFKLHSAFLLDKCKVFWLIGMLSIGIRYQPYSIIPTLLGSDFGDLGLLLWRQNNVIASWLRLWFYSNCIMHPWHVKSIWAHWYASHRHTVAALSYSVISTLLGSEFWLSGSFLESKWCHYVIAEAAILFKLIPSSTKCSSTLICCP